jgi:hypothetical protein
MYDCTLKAYRHLVRYGQGKLCVLKVASVESSYYFRNQSVKTQLDLCCEKGGGYRWHQWSTLKSTTDSVVNTLWFSPCSLNIISIHLLVEGINYLDCLKSIGLMTNERSASLLDNFLRYNQYHSCNEEEEGYNMRECGSHVERLNNDDWLVGGGAGW